LTHLASGSVEGSTGRTEREGETIGVAHLLEDGDGEDGEDRGRGG